MGRYRLHTVPGIGLTTALTLLAEVPELGQLDRKAIATLAGVTPLNRESGTRRGRCIVLGGRARIRAVLYSVIAPLVCADGGLTFKTIAFVSLNMWHTPD